MHDDRTLVGIFPPYTWKKKFKFLPDLFEIWHTDKEDDAGRVICGFNDYKKLSHIVHWRLRFMPLVRLQRKLFLRCAYCGGPSRKNNLVNHSTSWGREKNKFWCNQPHIYHMSCLNLYFNDKNQLRYTEEFGNYNDAYISGFTGAPYAPPVPPLLYGMTEIDYERALKAHEVTVRRVMKFLMSQDKNTRNSYKNS